MNHLKIKPSHPDAPSGFPFAIVNYKAEVIRPATSVCGKGRMMVGLLPLVLLLCVVLNTDALPGSIDLSFNPAFRGTVNGMALRNDDKIVVAGYFSVGVSSYGLLLLNTNGSFNSTFGSYGDAYRITATPDGKFIVFTSDTVQRLTVTGTADASFNPFPNNFSPSFMLVQADNKVLLGGDNFFIGTNVYNGVIRLNANGSLDVSYNAGLGANAEATCGALQADGKLLIGGDFTTVDGILIPYIARFNQDGSLDATFHQEFFTPHTFANITTISVQSDQRIVITGYPRCSSYCPTPTIARLNPDGSWDGSFIQLSASGISIALLQQDDKIVFLGSINLVNNTNPVGGIFRINSDGSYDSGFVAPTFHRRRFQCGLLQTNGQVLVGGYFASVDKLPLNTLVRLNGGGVQSSLSSPAYSKSQGFSATIFTHPGDTVSVVTSSNLKTWSPFTTFISTSSSTNLIDSSATRQPQRFYRVNSP